MLRRSLEAKVGSSCLAGQAGLHPALNVALAKPKHTTGETDIRQPLLGDIPVDGGAGDRQQGGHVLDREKTFHSSNLPHADLRRNFRLPHEIDRCGEEILPETGESRCVAEVITTVALHCACDRASLATPIATCATPLPGETPS